ncbi:MAG: hypothetical protein ACI9WS_002748 [Paraglaciecola psychrophila]|jgi:hypothetical protein
MSNNNSPTLSPQLQTLSDAAGEAWLYSLPLIEIATTRARGAARGGKLNSILHIPKLADHRARDVTTPNHDTLYSSAQLDLRAGPITLSLPAMGERYFSLALMDAYSNNFIILGTRTTGPEGGLFQLVGPDEAASGDHIIRAPTNQVWALGRILVAGPDDLQAARKMQAQLSLQGPALEHSQQYANRSASWQAYFASADALMLLNPPPVTDLAILRRIAPLGIGKGAFNADQFNAAQAAAIEQGISAARNSIRGSGIASAAVIDGWSYPSYELGDFGQAYAYRAGVALGGLAALPVVEAMYMTAQGDNGALFDGTQNWQLHFAAEQLIPVDSFWSLSLYEATQDGQFFFVDNSLNRYIISDRSAGLQYNDDGSLDIWIGAQHPGAARQANWLPAPAGLFALFIRAYLPQPRLLQGSYRLPPITPVV